ncbi:MAG: inorganic phosphate transporter [Anaerolineae bacterium]|jgi:PiT family inorganic phosphate transporter
MLSPFLVFFVGVALVFDFLNGFHDSSNVVATTISSRAMAPQRALVLSALASLAGPFIMGVAVARTIGHEVVVETAATTPVVLAALLSAITWNVLTWLLAIPSSSSHALMGGLVGAVAVGHGLRSIIPGGLFRVLLSLFISPLVGLAVGYLMMKVILVLARAATPRINYFFRRAQTLTALALALSHGANDAQKTMGIIAMGLLARGALTHFRVPTWVIGASAGAMALGTALGGWRIIHTLGRKFYRIRPIHGFTSQIAAGGVILTAALLGGPVSTTHVVSSSILGVGSAERLNKVRWNVAGPIAAAWLFTIPATGSLAALLYPLLQRFVS